MKKMAADFAKLNIKDSWGNRASSPTATDLWSYRNQCPSIELSPYRAPITRPISPVSPKLSRAKSVPPTSSLHHKNLNVPARPNTVVATNKTECSRVYQVEHEGTRKQMLKGHLPTRKSNTPPWQRELDATPMPVMVSPAYTLAKSKNKIVMTIKSDAFFEEAHPDNDYSKKRQDPQSTALISQLHQQIDNLTLFLEEERLNHKDTKRKAADLLRNQVESLHTKHANTVTTMETSQKEEVDEIRGDYDSLIVENQKYFDLDNPNARTVVSKMKSEIEFLQGAFESYKSQLLKEMDMKWSKKSTAQELQYKDDLDKRTKELHDELLTDSAHDVAQKVKEHQTQCSRMKRDHKKEVDAMLRRFANHAEDQRKLEETDDKLTTLEKKHNQLVEDYNRVCQRLACVAIELSETKLGLIGYEQNFEDKVKEVDDNYKERMHELMIQNLDIRRQHMKKCDELFNLEIEMKATQEEKLSTAKNTMKPWLQNSQVRNKETRAVAAVGGSSAVVPPTSFSSSTSTSTEQHRNRPRDTDSAASDSATSAKKNGSRQTPDKSDNK